ncbi:DUF4435 domain-containing protein, partial [Qipengyuania sp. DY56-A-20]
MKSLEFGDYAAYLLEQGASENATLHEFGILWEPGGSSLHVFVEGDDDAVFYLPEVRRRAHARSIQLHVCNGKPKLRIIREEVLTLTGNSERCLFFTDRDFDDYLGTQITPDLSTYVTDYYAIENHVCSSGSLEILLSDFFRISRADPLFDHILQGYSRLEEVFASKMLALMSWVVAFREASGRPNLSNCNKLDKVIRLTIPDQVDFCERGFSRFKIQIGAVENPVPLARLLYWRRRFSNDEIDLWIRGKYKKWFFRKAV